MKKKFKAACINQRVTKKRLPNKDAIWLKRKICNKWEQVKLTYLSYFYIKILIKNQFNDISTAIMNSNKKIDIDLISDSQKKIYTEILKRID